MKTITKGFNRLLTAQGRILYKLSLVALALALVAFLYQAYVLHAWTRIDATVTGGTASYALDSASTRCTADYRLAFKIGDSEYTATDHARVAADCATLGTQLDANVGKTQAILYNPVDPTVTYLHPGYNTEFFFLPLLLLTLSVGMVTLGFFCIRAAEWSEMEDTSEVSLSLKAPKKESRPVPVVRRRA